MGTPKKDRMYSTGLVIPDLAAGFLVRTDSKCCMIDNIVSNPVANKFDRGPAVTQLIEDLEGLAKDLGYEVVSILSNIEKMDLRLMDLGFKHQGKYNLFYKEMAIATS